jgi:hypothetical protein
VSPIWAPDVNHKDEPGGVNGVGPTSPAGSASTGPEGKDPTGAEGGSSTGGSRGQTGVAAWPFLVAGSAAVVVLLLALPALRRTAVRRRRRPSEASGATPPDADVTVAAGEMRVLVGGRAAEVARRDAHAAWDELVDTLLDYGIPLDDAETPRVTAERIADSLRLHQDAAEGARRLGQAEERARYARVPLGSSGLPAALRAVRAAIAGRATRGTRLRAVLMPPSVLRRWRIGLVNVATGVTATLTGWSDTAVRVMRPRRLLTGRAGSRSG